MTTKMSIVAIQQAARELHEAAARFDILHEEDGYRYGSAMGRYEKAQERMLALLERAEPVPDAAKRAA